MELRHLRYFVALVEEQHFGRAAARLFISQSTLSEQIRSLEREIGGPLLQRTPRRVELTEAGRLLLPEARLLIEGSDHALRLVRASTAGEVGSMRVGFSGVAALSGVLGEDLGRFQSAHPKVELELTEAAPPMLADRLRAGSLDIAYAPDLGTADGITVRRRAVIHPVVALPQQHRLAARSAVHLSDLADEQLVAFATEHDEWATGLIEGIAAGRVRAAASTLGVLALVSVGVGVAVVPHVLEQVAMSRVVYRPLRGAADLSIVTMIRIGEPTAAVQELIRLTDEQVAPAQRHR